MKKWWMALLLAGYFCSATAENINLKLQNMELRAALQSVGNASGVNIVADENVQGKVTLELEDVSLDEALKLLVAGRDLTYFYTDNGVVVTSLAKSSNFAEGVHVFQPGYVFVKDIREVLTALFEKGRIAFDNDTNTIFVMGGAPEVTKLQKVMKFLDRASRQVTLQAEIYAVSREDMQKLGVNWDWDKIPQRESSSDSDSSDSTEDNYGGNFKFWHGFSFRFAATLNLLQSKGRAKLLATPKLIVVNGKEGKIFVGDKIPVQMEKHDTSGRYDSTEYVEAGVKMHFQPLINADGSLVTLKTKLEVSTPILVSELNNYKITSRGTETVVRIGTGRTMVIGGLINQEEQRTLQKVPFLGDLPLLGVFFKHRTKVKNKMEVIMLLTPYVTEAGEAPTIFNLDDVKEDIFKEKMR